MQEQRQMMTHLHITLDSPEKRLTEMRMASSFDKIWKLRSQCIEDGLVALHRTDMFVHRTFGLFFVQRRLIHSYRLATLFV
jgi:hypothetical protein